jgi:hypothetical protein
MKLSVISTVAMLAVLHGADAFAPSGAIGLLRAPRARATAVSSHRPALRKGRFALQVIMMERSAVCVFKSVYVGSGPCVRANMFRLCTSRLLLLVSVCV